MLCSVAGTTTLDREWHLKKDEVLLTVGCPIFPFYIDSQISVHRKFKKNRSIDIYWETQKKYISMKHSQFFNYLLYAKSK
jgi:hypothetical protein